jgi:hypothetical protein
MRIVTSAIKDLNLAIGSGNPFEGRASVREPDIWGAKCPDLEPLNTQATVAIWEAINQASTGRYPTRSVALLADAGMGKSHMIGRIRHQLQVYDKAVFAYINAQQFTDSNLIRQQLLYAIADSLRYTGSQGVMQWQELALFLVNQALVLSQTQAASFVAKKLVKKLNDQTLAKHQLWVNQVLDILFKSQPDIENPDLIRAVIWTLCNAQAPFARYWLAGRNLAKWKLEDLGLPDRSNEHRESLAWEITSQLLKLLLSYQPVVLCFDRIETDESSDSALKKEHVAASIIKRLADSHRQEDNRYGIVFLSVMTPDTWEHKVQPLLGRSAECISGNRDPILLESINAEKLNCIVGQWLAEFYAERNIVPPTPVYPFDSIQLQSLVRENLTLRDAIAWCAENFKPVEIDPLERVETVFDRQLKTLEFGAALTNNLEIEKALFFCCEMLRDRTIYNVQVADIAWSKKQKSTSQNSLGFQIRGREREPLSQDNLIQIDLAVVQDTDGKRVSAGLKQLIGTQSIGTQCDRHTRKCLIRSKAKKLSPQWKASQYLHQLLVEEDGRWIDLTLDAITPLLTLHSIYLDRETHQLTAEQILEFSHSCQLIENNPLIREIFRPSTPDNPAIPANQPDDSIDYQLSGVTN